MPLSRRTSTAKCRRIRLTPQFLNAVNGSNAALSDSKIKILSFNIQYLAGKDYVFYYDVKGGPDSRPSNAAIDTTLDRVASIIAEEDPDLVLIQEINDSGDSRTHYRDQIAELQAALDQRMSGTDGQAAYPCFSRTHYWQVPFVPHPNILGPVSMHLLTLSKYPITSAQRHQFTAGREQPADRALLFSIGPFSKTVYSCPMAKRLPCSNTHFDAWAQGTGTMPAQVGHHPQPPAPAGSSRHPLDSRWRL